jgi:hypothetical protein
MRIMMYALLFAGVLIAIAGGGCASVRGNIYPLPGSYPRESDLFARLKNISDAKPGLAVLRVIGFSGVQQLPVYALQIGRNSATRNVLIIGQHHGDEVLGVWLALELAQDMALLSGNTRKWDKILDEYRFWVVPTINPEGLRMVTEGTYQWKRKNNRDTDGNGKLDPRTDGVDLNRNYPVFWGDDPPVQQTSPYYKGERAFSEPEVQAVMNLAMNTPFELAIFYHSSASGAYSEKIFIPSNDPRDPNQKKQIEALLAWAKSYGGKVKKDYAKGTYEVGEVGGSRVGNARNYFFHTFGTNAFLVELGGIDPQGISVIHPHPHQAQKIVNRHRKALRELLLENIDQRN